MRPTPLPNCAAFALTLAVCLGGCSKIIGGWHARAGLDAEDFFDDPQVIALCEAIEANDLEAMDRLIAEGADVNAVGKAGVTPLLWAFPEDKFERFEKLLQHGADPNVLMTDAAAVNRAFPEGHAVTHLAFGSSFDRHWRAVLEHGGDPNLTTQGRRAGVLPVLHVTIRGRGANKIERVRALAEAGADLDARGVGGVTPAMRALLWGGQYDLAAELVRLGASLDVRQHIYQTNVGLRTLPHFVAEELLKPRPAAPDLTESLQGLVDLLEREGVDMDAAKQDIVRWRGISGTPLQRKRAFLAEAREIAAKEKATQAAEQQDAAN
ncbi:ankyrin repeat domain-containing protein [Botrimarina sp.]|uniref:ankyrin repeat domain-containing protein n=1 Tax=Botrimarina sp. TaxID=2795802 RepID=UPI0032EE27F4